LGDFGRVDSDVDGVTSKEGGGKGGGVGGGRDVIGINDGAACGASGVVSAVAAPAVGVSATTLFS